MTEYDFTLKFRLANSGDAPDAYIDALAEAGCDDAIVGIGQKGSIALNFTREASSAQGAIVSALKSVKRAIPGATLVEASPDFVGVTEVAAMMGCSRQNIRKLMHGYSATFPDAVHEGNQAFWHLLPVLNWFAEHQNRTIERSLIEVAEVTMKLNVAKEIQRLKGGSVPKVIQSALV